MIAINKGQEPPSLTECRQSPHCNYDNYRGKAALREALVREQRGLCCYCMGRIKSTVEKMRIEHWRCQAENREDRLNYRNLLAACPGVLEAPGRRYYHCDNSKGKQQLRWNPANPEHRIEDHVSYKLDGSIRSGDAEFDAQLDEVLNLNLPELKNARKGERDGVADWLRQRKNEMKGPVPRNEIERKLERYAGGNGPLEPYRGAAIWLLRQRLSGAAR